jgi:hypothetical protein
MSKAHDASIKALLEIIEGRSAEPGVRVEAIRLLVSILQSSSF